MHISEFQGKAVTDLFLPMIQKRKKDLGWDVLKTITYPENAMSLASEVGEAKTLKPDVLFVVARQRDALMLVSEMYKQRFDVDGIFGIVCPGFADPGYQKEKLSSFSFNVTPWHDEVQPFAKKVAEEYQRQIQETLQHERRLLLRYDPCHRRQPGAGEEHGQGGPEKGVEGDEPHRKTSIGKAIEFDEKGDNKGAGAALMQLQRNKAKVVYPPFAETAKAVYPVPSWKDRG